MTRRPPTLIAAAILSALTFAASAQASAQYPYTIIDPGTFGGPNSFFDGPGVPISSNGTLVGAADTSTLNPEFPDCPPPGGCSDQYIQHAFTWHNGKLTDLGALPGQNTSAIFELNSSGVGVGSSEDGLTDPFTDTPASVAVMFLHGRVIDLGPLPGGYESNAQDIDEGGQVAGFSSNGTVDPYSMLGWVTQTRTFVWRDGVMRDIGTLGGPDAVEQDQNDQGEIIGNSYTNDTPNSDSGVPTQDPFLWQNGHMIDLGTLGGDYGSASWLNDRGALVGFSYLAGDNTVHPFVWNGRRMIDLGTLGGDNGFANWVSDSGDVAGGAQTADDSWNGVLWHDGKMIDLPPVDGAPWSFANSVTDEDQVVGNTSDTSSNELDAVLWTGGHAYDLNALVAPSAVQLTAAQYINDQGDIVSNAVLPNGDQRMVLLVPNRYVPLPRASTPARRLPSTGVRDESATSLLALDTADLGGGASGIHQLMLSVRRSDR
jgi:probable HAF family extracellular repeat protein